MSETTALTYSISEKGTLLVISLLGAGTKANETIIEKCQKEISEKQGIKSVVVSFQDVSSLDFAGAAALVRLQKSIRDRPSAVRICCLKTDFRIRLDDRGAIRTQEICKDLAESLKSLGLLEK